MEKLYVRPELREMGTVAAKATNLLTLLPIVVGGEMCVAEGGLSDAGCEKLRFEMVLRL